MVDKLFSNIEQTIAVILFGIGLTTLLMQRNLIKKIIGLNIIDTSVYLFLAAIGFIEGREAPIVVDGITKVEHYINPIPNGLVLTGIVVSVSFTAIMLALTIRLHRRYGTLDIDQIMWLAQKEAK